jgi:hypothetical protein
MDMTLIALFNLTSPNVMYFDPKLLSASLIEHSLGLRHVHGIKVRRYLSCGMKTAY